jgi:hypothetical protein
VAELVPVDTSGASLEPVANPSPEELLTAVRDGSDRLDELCESLGYGRMEVAPALLELVERGDLAVLPVGNVVKLRDEERAQ